MTSRRAAPFLAAAVPLAAVIWFVLAFGVDVPRHDEWNMIEGIGRAFDGSLEFADLWAPHNEHVAFFDHVAIVGMALLSRWNLRAAMLATVALAAVSLLFLAWILRRVPGLPAWAVPLAACFVFSLHAVDNWLWGGQIQLAITVMGTVGALALLGSSTLRWPVLGAAILLGFVGSWSFLAGFLVWPIGAALVAIRPFPERGWRVRALVSWLVSAGVAIGVPLVVYSGRAFAPKAGSSWWRIADFVVSYVGAGLIGPTTEAWAARTAGWTGIAVLVCCSAWIVARRRESPALLSFVATGLFGLATGCMIALGRLTASLTESATTSRYTSFGGLSWIVIALMPWLVGERPSRVRAAAGGAFALAIVAVLLATQPARIAEGRRVERGRSEAARALRTGEGMSLGVLEAAFGDPGSWLPGLHDRLAILRRLRLSLFREATASELAPERWNGPLSASIDVVSEGGRAMGRVRARGGVPGNAAFAVLTRDGVPGTATLTLDATGSAEVTIEAGPAPVPASATLLVFSLDREGRVIRSPPVPVSR